MIPCSLMVQSLDGSKLAHHSRPNSATLHLVRTIEFYRIPCASALQDNTSKITDRRIIEEAKWWITAKDGLHGFDERRLEGEIHLGANLQPSCEFPLSLITVSVASSVSETHWVVNDNPLCVLVFSRVAYLGKRGNGGSTSHRTRNQNRNDSSRWADPIQVCARSTNIRRPPQEYFRWEAYGRVGCDSR